MKVLSIQKTVFPPHQIINYSAWIKYIRNRNNQKFANISKQRTK